MIGQKAINSPSISKSKKSSLSYNIPNLSQIIIPNNEYTMNDKTIKIYNTIIISYILSYTVSNFTLDIGIGSYTLTCQHPST